MVGRRGILVLACAVALEAGCKDEHPPAPKVTHLHKPQTTAVPLKTPAPEGVKAELYLDRFQEATFEDITVVLPESLFVGASVEGDSFSVRGEVYVLRLILENSSSKEIHLPELRVSRPNPVVGAEDVVFESRRKTVAAGKKERFYYFWDPGIPVAQASARLVWRP